MSNAQRFLEEHREVTRRFFLQGLAAGAAWAVWPTRGKGEELPPDCAKACEEFLKRNEFLTSQEKFGNVSRGNPKPYDLSDEKKKEVGMTQETWQLEVVSDPENKADLENPLTKAAGTALNWDGLMRLAEKQAVSFGKVMTCNNIGRPLGMGFWEGVPLRNVIWMAKPTENVRRVFYHGYHNDDPQQIFRSSLPIGRVLEDPFDLPPVILCYKLNGQYLNSQRGGPVRLVVPEMYGYKSVKWLQKIVLSNLFHANDTYASGNNDIDSWLKTFAHSLYRPEQTKPGQPIPVTGYAQVGISGLTRVETCLLPKDMPWPADDPYFTQAPWTPAHILPPPSTWGGQLPDNQLPKNLHGFNPETGKPLHWPLRLSMIHWAALLPGLPAGEYTLRSRTIDEKGQAQPLPRPFKKSGRNAIESLPIVVKN